MRVIPQRELRNDIGRVLRQVEAGAELRITVGGRPVADLVPIRRASRSFVGREQVARLLRVACLDPGFGADLDAVVAGTIDEL